MSTKAIMPDPFEQSITDVTQEAEPSERLEMLNAFAKEIYSKKDIQLKTELNMSQIMSFSKAILFADRYKNPILPKWVKNMMELLVSKGRSGRKELVNISSAMVAGATMNPEPQRPSMSERLFGK